MKIPVPDYLLESVLTHYNHLARSYRYDGKDRAANAARVAQREIAKVRALIEKERDNNKN